MPNPHDLSWTEEDATQSVPLVNLSVPHATPQDLARHLFHSPQVQMAFDDQSQHTQVLIGPWEEVIGDSGEATASSSTPREETGLPASPPAQYHQDEIPPRHHLRHRRRRMCEFLSGGYQTLDIQTELVPGYEYVKCVTTGATYGDCFAVLVHFRFEDLPKIEGWTPGTRVQVTFAVRYVKYMSQWVKSLVQSNVSRSLRRVYGDKFGDLVRSWESSRRIKSHNIPLELRPSSPTPAPAPAQLAATTLTHARGESSETPDEILVSPESGRSDADPEAGLGLGADPQSRSTVQEGPSRNTITKTTPTFINHLAPPHTTSSSSYSWWWWWSGVAAGGVGVRIASTLFDRRYPGVGGDGHRPASSTFFPLLILPPLTGMHLTHSTPVLRAKEWYQSLRDAARDYTASVWSYLSREVGDLDLPSSPQQWLWGGSWGRSSRVTPSPSAPILALDPLSMPHQHLHLVIKATWERRWRTSPPPRTNTRRPPPSLTSN